MKKFNEENLCKIENLLSGFKTEEILEALARKHQKCYDQAPFEPTQNLKQTFHKNIIYFLREVGFRVNPEVYKNSEGP